MKIRILLSSLLLALLSAAPVIHAQGDDDEKTDLEKQMTIISKSVRTLRKQISDAAQNEASIALVAKIHDAAVASAKLTPKWAADQADKDKFMADYQAGQKEFIEHVDQLTAALKANDNDGAAKILKDLLDLEKKDHKEFRKPEKKE
jgi:soluble cytochrome b562